MGIYPYKDVRIGPKIPRYPWLGGMLLNCYTNTLLGIDKFGNASENRCNNVENLVDVGMGEMVISAPLEVAGRRGSGKRTPVASQLRKGLRMLTAAVGCLAPVFP